MSSLGPVMPVTPLLRWSANQAARSSGVYEIRHEMTSEIRRVEENFMERIDGMVDRLDQMIALMERLLANIETLHMLASGMLGTEMLNSEQMKELVEKLGSMESPEHKRLPSSLTSNFGSSSRF